MYYTVLIVDDELIIRQGIEYMLNWEEEGFQIIGKAKNGEEALQIIEARHPDIVITDIEMPNMNGLELAEIIAKQHPEIQMIMLSAHQNFEYVRPSFSLGAVDYMLKSALSSEELRKTLKKSIKGLAKQTNLSDAGFSQKISRYLSGYDQEFSYKEFHIEFPVHVFILGKSEEKKMGKKSCNG
ncbi:response regulator [uncultured Dubosiella sp.]|uniref:response regulator n=1 Tax=uncultured Dubosiella sp. TaxID=1937011 RepID=UPI002593DD67|nr:response regulator [uncultured Dubosiella sp.]